MCGVHAPPMGSRSPPGHSHASTTTTTTTRVRAQQLVPRWPAPAAPASARASCALPCTPCPRRPPHQTAPLPVTRAQGRWVWALHVPWLPSSLRGARRPRPRPAHAHHPTMPLHADLPCPPHAQHRVHLCASWLPQDPDPWHPGTLSPCGDHPDSCGCACLCAATAPHRPLHTVGCPPQGGAQCARTSGSLHACCFPSARARAGQMSPYLLVPVGLGKCLPGCAAACMGRPPACGLPAWLNVLPALACSDVLCGQAGRGQQPARKVGGAPSCTAERKGTLLLLR